MCQVRHNEEVKSQCIKSKKLYYLQILEKVGVLMEGDRSLEAAGSSILSGEESALLGNMPLIRILEHDF